MTSPGVDETVRALEAALVSPEAGTRYIVDFDHTLMLSNSTEEFVNCARPAFLLAFMMKALGALKPWRIAGKTGYFVWRDIIRISVICLFAPWTLVLFARKAPAIFTDRLNRRLDKVLEAVDPADIVIVSFGFRFILKALLKGTKYEAATLVAPRFWQMGRVRRQGKAAYLESEKIKFDTERDFVITDSAKDDADLLGTYQNSFCIDWPEKITRGAFSGMYIPFFYTARIKRTPGFFIKQVVLEELPIVLLAFGLFLPGVNISVLACLTLFFAAYICVYEIGYAENDRVGLKKEAAPKLTDAFYKYQNYRLQPYAWIWAIVLTALGASLLDGAIVAQAFERLGLDRFENGWIDKAVIAGIWMVVVVTGRILFWIFNQAALKMRVFVYIPLHVSKYLGPILLFPTHPAGLALIAAHIVRTWALYAIRRAGGDIEFLPSQFVRLAFLIFLLPLFALASGPSENIIDGFFNWQVGLIIAFCVLRPVPEFYKKVLRAP